MEAKCSDRGWKEQNNDPKMYTLFLNCFDMLVHQSSIWLMKRTVRSARRILSPDVESL